MRGVGGRGVRRPMEETAVLEQGEDFRLLLGAMPGCGQSPQLEFAVVLTVI